MRNVSMRAAGLALVATLAASGVSVDAAHAGRKNASVTKSAIKAPATGSKAKAKIVKRGGTLVVVGAAAAR